jgi:hypothetical protein
VSVRAFVNERRKLMFGRSGPLSRRIALLGLVTSLLVFGVAAGAQAHRVKKVTGTVVHVNKGAGSFVVANGKGHLYAIHSASSPALGSKVKVSVRRLHNGTFSSTGTTSGGHPRHVRVHGTVTHDNAGTHSFTVSGRGVSMLVHSKTGHALPPVGTVVTVKGAVDDENDGQVEEEDLQEEGEDNNGVDLEGVVLEVNELARTITISSEDDQSEGETVVVNVPETFNISMFTVGEEVALNVKPLEGGGFELVGSASDEGEQGANDNEDEQGEQGEEGEGEQGENENEQ